MMNTFARQLFQLLDSEHYETKIRKAGIFRFPSNYRFESHAHKEYEINYINTGCCIMGIGSDFVPLRQGECIIISPQLSHCFMVDMQKACKITQLEIRIRTPKQLPEDLKFPMAEGQYCKLKSCEGILPVLEQISVLHRLDHLSNTEQANLDLLLLQLYAQLSGEMEKKEQQQEHDERETGPVGEIIHYIHENLDEELNMEKLAEEHGISSRYVRRFFKEQIGMGSNEYINMLRLGKAKQLLCNPNYTITQVALMSGFTSSQYFCRVFRRQMNVSPAEYRKSWRDTQHT
ncbi:MAG: AraC family transcriptional regulator [Lachnospiraceae bacterium]|nr:AraC family transcriptional regulator [Lachnospiraceae bacterium]